MRLGGVLAGLVLVVLGVTQAGASGGEPALAPATPTTLAPTLTTTTTVPGATTVPGPVLTAPRRGGATAGTTAKPADEDWSVRRIVTTIGSFVVGLALLGFVYGRIRSTTPRRPPLAPTSD
jgi:hypothetical protein